MSVEQNKQVMRRFYDEVFNAGRLEAIDELLAPDFAEREEFPGLPPDREGVKQFFGMFRNAFPDMRVTVHDMIGEGDKIAARYTMTGTHRGEFMGMAPTGKPIEVSAMDIVRFAGGKVAEHWGITDQMAMMQQLGAIPA
ncbi:MAG: ester cyclase [Chloroflexi bacterium]|nr:ester cyclase [Chloroflexota bacterium]